MAQPIDQGAIIRSGMSLVPDLAGQMMQDRMIKVQEQGNLLRQQQEARLLTEATRKWDREQAFQQEYDAAVQSGQPGAIANLMGRYPEYSEAIKRQYDTQSDEKKRADLGAYSEWMSNLNGGRIEPVRAAMRARVEAERRAGIEEPDERELLAMLDSGDPGQVAQVKARLEGVIYSIVGPERFASVFGAFNPEPTGTERDYNFFRDTYGQAAADSYAQNRYDPVHPVVTQNGTTAYRSSQLSGGPAPSPVARGSAPAPVQPASEEDAGKIITGAMRTKFVTPEDWARIDAALGPRGRNAAEEWRKKHGIQIGREINGKRYVKRGNDWFEVK